MEFVFDLGEQGLRLRIPNWHIATILIDHIMTTIRCIEDSSLACGPERLDCEQLAFFHLRRLATFYDWHTLASVDRVWTNRMATKVMYGFDWVYFVTDFDLM